MLNAERLKDPEMRDNLSRFAQFLRTIVAYAYVVCSLINRHSPTLPQSHSCVDVVLEGIESACVRPQLRVLFSRHLVGGWKGLISAEGKRHYFHRDKLCWVLSAQGCLKWTPSLQQLRPVEGHPSSIWCWMRASKAVHEPTTRNTQSEK